MNGGRDAARREVHWTALAALLVGGVLIGCLLVEGALRVYLHYLAPPEHRRYFMLYSEIPIAERQYSPHPYNLYIPTPGFHRGATSHNSLGFRGPEIELPKPPGRFRIALLGGSTTYTIAVEDDALTFPAQLQDLLGADPDLAPVDVVNAGVGGYNSWETLINLEFRVLDVEPDLVMVYHGTNDVHPRLVDPSTYRGDNTGRRRPWTPPPIAWWEHSAVLRVIARKGGFSRQVMLGDFVDAPYSGPALLERDGVEPDAVLDANPPRYFARNLRNMVAVARQNGVQIVLATWAHSSHFTDYAATPYYQRAYVENNEVVRRVARETGVPLFDFASLMPQDAEYWADGRHVNERGAALKARLFADFLLERKLVPERG